jgi:hypothetical protein
LRTKPFPLTLQCCRTERNLNRFATKLLSNFGGIRRTNTIGKELSVNLEVLDEGLWSELLQRLNALRPAALQHDEQEVADSLAERFLGLGPKQSRNLLQGLGLTRFEIPLDSRFTKWLNEFGFPVRVSAAALGDSNYYQFISQGIQQLCKVA